MRANVYGVTVTHRLPETEENDQLDAQDFQEGLVFRKILLQLNIELDQQKHGDSD